MNPKLITFLSDFGLKDEWVAVCKAVIRSIDSRVPVLDITHQIPSFDIRKGAFVLASAVRSLPAAIHLAVVDPGVGTRRHPIVVETGRGDLLVGPDNGLLVPALRRLGGLKRAVVAENEAFYRRPVSPTFQARDVFAPVAAHLSGGVDPAEFGREVADASLAPAPWPDPSIEDRRAITEVVDIDRFGTVRLNLDRSHLDPLGLVTGGRATIAFGSRTLELTLSETFGDVKPGAPLLLVDSSEMLCVAVNQGSAAERFGLQPGIQVLLTRGARGSYSVR